MFGILNINKPQGWTSHDVVAKLRKILKIKQVGHTGTLDPISTGVLPICIGKATKTIQYLNDTKAYRAFATLGIKTSSYDTEGEIIEKKEVNVSVQEIKEALEKYKGEIEQTPPIHSAVHYKGKRLYEYARKNIEIKDIPTRKVFIKSIDFVELQEGINPVLVFDVDCSTGTYIRSIINDLGQDLNCGAMMSGLIRTRSGSFKISDSYTIEKIEELYKDNKLSEAIINPADAIKLSRIEIDENTLDKIKMGQYFKYDDLEQDEKVQLIHNNALAAIAEFRDGKIYPKNVFA